MCREYLSLLEWNMLIVDLLYVYTRTSRRGIARKHATISWMVFHRMLLWRRSSRRFVEDKAVGFDRAQPVNRAALSPCGEFRRMSSRESVWPGTKYSRTSWQAGRGVMLLSKAWSSNRLSEHWDLVDRCSFIIRVSYHHSTSTLQVFTFTRLRRGLARMMLTWIGIKLADLV